MAGILLLVKNLDMQSRKIQIGVMGSASDLGYDSKLEKLAEGVGFYIAKNNCVLIFGAEKDGDSLSTVASRAAKKEGGITIGITYGKGLNTFEQGSDAIIATGLERGGGRELPLVLSCDAIICLSGGSGTLTEMAIAYQAGIPVVVIEGTGGWSDKLANQFIDARNRIKVYSARTPEDAVVQSLKLIKKS